MTELIIFAAGMGTAALVIYAALFWAP